MSIFISVYVSWSVFVREGVCVCLFLCISVQLLVSETANQRSLYGVATISRLLKIIGLFCRIPSLL